jgi:hypothetical protein
MKKLALMALVGCALGLPSLDAAIYKGQKLYVEKCRSCHGLGQVFVTARTQAEWAALMKGNGALIAKLHVKNDKAAESHHYFKGDGWTSNSHHIRDFMIEYAADSGNIPVCE